MQGEEMVQILKIVNDLRDDIRENRREIKLNREQNEKRWEKNEKRWEENEKRWEEYRKERKQDKEDIKNILISFQNAIEKMFEEQNKRIEKLEEQFRMMNV